MFDRARRDVIDSDTAHRRVFVFIGLHHGSYGGMENHGQHLVDWLRQSPPGLALVAVFAKDAQGHTVQLDEHGKVLSSWEAPGALAATLQAQGGTRPILFFNTAHWIEELAQLRLRLPTALFCARTGGNEIVQAPLRNMRTQHPQRQQFWTRTINQTIDVLVTNSVFTEQRLIQIGIDPSKCARIPGGVDAALAERGAHAARRTQAVARKRVVWAGRFVAFKGLSVLLHAIHRLGDQAPELVLIGDGPLLPTIREQVQQLGLQQRVCLPGACSPQQSLQDIAAGDLYAATSLAEVRTVPGGSYVHTETMGRSVMEALSCGLRVVASQVGGLPELIEPDLGELVSPGDPDAVAAAIRRQLTLSPLTESRRRHLAALFDWSTVFDAYRELWSRSDA